MTPIEPHPRQLGLSDYLALLGRRKWVIVQSTLIVAVVAFVLSAQQDKVFAASAEVLLSRQNLSNVITGVTSPDAYVDPERFAQTQAGLARAPGGRGTRGGRVRAHLPHAGRPPRGAPLCSRGATPTSCCSRSKTGSRRSRPGWPTPTRPRSRSTRRTSTPASCRRLEPTSSAGSMSSGVRGCPGSDLYRELVDSAQQLQDDGAAPDPQPRGPTCDGCRADRAHTEPKRDARGLPGAPARPRHRLPLGDARQARAHGGGDRAAPRPLAAPLPAPRAAATPREGGAPGDDPRSAGRLCRGDSAAAHQPGVREHRPRREGHPGDERRPTRGEVDDDRQPGGCPRAIGAQRGSRGSRSSTTRHRKRSSASRGSRE